MQVYFRTRGGDQHGWGNIIRLYNFSKLIIAKSKKYKITFLVEGDNEIINFFIYKKINYIKLDNDIDIYSEEKIINKLNNRDFLICEMLDLSFERQQMYARKFLKTAVFDDLLNQKYCTDYVICAQDWKKYGAIEMSKENTIFLIGYKYFIFNNDFKKLYLQNGNKNKSIINNSVKKILIILGGGNYNIIYEKIALAFENINEYQLTFITGYKHHIYIKNMIKKILPKAIIIGKKNNIAKYFNNTDIAIVGGGYTKIESAIMNIPSISISVQWHQIPLVKNFVKKTESIDLGYFSEFHQNDIIEAVIKLEKKSERLKIIKNYQKYFSIGGAEELYKRLFNND